MASKIKRANRVLNQRKESNHDLKKQKQSEKKNDGI